MIIFFVFILVLSNSFALQPEFIYKTWNVYRTRVDDKVVCYTMSIPIEQRGNYKRKGESYFMVIKPSNSEFPEVVVSGGGLNDDKKEGDITILKRRFPLFPQDERNLTHDRNDDIEIVKQMSIGAKAYVKSFFDNGYSAIDTYSLIGFTQAFDKMVEICR